MVEVVDDREIVVFQVCLYFFNECQRYAAIPGLGDSQAFCRVAAAKRGYHPVSEQQVQELLPPGLSDNGNNNL